MLLFLRMLLWPVMAGGGFAFVVWFYELTDSTRTWREVDEAISLSLAAWFAIPALTWALVPGRWGRPNWAVWTLAVGGVSVFVAFVVLTLLFLYFGGVDRLANVSLQDLPYLFRQLGEHSVEKWVWSAGPAAFYLLAPAIGHAVGLAMIARSLAAIFFFMSLVGSLAVFLFFLTIAQAAAGLWIEAGWDAGLATSAPIASGIAFVSSLFGAAAILIWGAAIGPRQIDDDPEVADEW